MLLIVVCSSKRNTCRTLLLAVCRSSRLNRPAVHPAQQLKSFYLHSCSSRFCSNETGSNILLHLLFLVSVCACHSHCVTPESYSGSGAEDIAEARRHASVILFLADCVVYASIFSLRLLRIGTFSSIYSTRYESVKGGSFHGLLSRWDWRIWWCWLFLY